MFFQDPVAGTASPNFWLKPSKQIPVFVGETHTITEMAKSGALWVPASAKIPM